MSLDTPFFHLFSAVKRIDSLIIYFLACVLAFLYIDRPLAEYFHQVGLNDNAPLLLFSNLGLSYLYILGLPLLAAVFYYILKNKEVAFNLGFLWTSVICVEVVCVVLKIACGRARPLLWFDYQIWGFYGFKLSKLFWSFPSGHTLIAMTMTTGLGIFFPRFFYPLLALGFSIAFSRIILGFHYLSDVMAAVYIAWIVLGLLAFKLPILKNRKKIF